MHSPLDLCARVPKISQQPMAQTLSAILNRFRGKNRRQARTPVPPRFVSIHSTLNCNLLTSPERMEAASALTMKG